MLQREIKQKKITIGWNGKLVTIHVNSRLNTVGLLVSRTYSKKAIIYMT